MPHKEILGAIQGAYGAIDLGLGGRLPGGITPGLAGVVEHGERPVKTWVANGATFIRFANGKIAVEKKDGTIKVYRPYKPTVFGKRTDVTKFVRLSKKYQKEYTELHKLFGKRTRRSTKCR